MNYLHFPKIELHVHLDCCLSYEVVRELNPDITRGHYEKYFLSNGKCHNLADYLQKAVRAVELMQDERSLRLVTADLFDQFMAENVIYVEVRFAPLLHTGKGLSARQVVDIVDDALSKEMSRTGIQSQLILCTLRHYSEVESMKTVKLVETFKDRNVVAFDIAADEAGYPIDNHIGAFNYARENGIPCTAHAGEASGAGSVWETIQHFHPARIGHGVRSIEDPDLVNYLRDHKIHLEVCPTSNIETNIYHAMKDHPINQLLDAGISVGVNTDGRTISGTTLSTEYLRLDHAFGWGLEEILKCNMNALEAAFISDEKREVLLERLQEGFMTRS